MKKLSVATKLKRNKMKFHHVGIFVANIKSGDNFFKSLIKINNTSKIINDKNLGIKVKFLYDCKNICYELVAPLGIKNPVDKVLKKRSNIINHIAYKVKDLNRAIIYMRKKKLCSYHTTNVSKSFKKESYLFFNTFKFYNWINWRMTIIIAIV